MTSAAAMAVPTAAACSLAVAYVGSLYIWRTDKDRDHPETIKRRFVSAFLITLIAPLFVCCFGAPDLLSRHSLAVVIGVRRAGLAQAIALPLALTVMLFLGPVAMLLLGDRGRVYFIPNYCVTSLRDWIWWRNHVVAPFTEEYTFRACMLPILLGYYSPRGAVVISPLFFGIAHFHHMIERVRKGQEMKTAFFISSFQFAYTTIFGMYSAFLFVRTGHVVAPVVVHGFCNFMGFPDLAELLQQEPKKRLILSGFFVLGLIAFYTSLFTFTEPSIYHNDVYNW